MREIYADNSATTKLSPVVLEKMLPYLTEVYGNPSSIYRIGGKAREALDQARENIAKNLGARSTSPPAAASRTTGRSRAWRTP